MDLEGINTGIFGMPGTGKTFAANWLIRRDRFVLAHDQTGHLLELGRRKFDRFDGSVTIDPQTIPDMLAEAKENGTGFRIAQIDLQGRQLMTDSFLKHVENESNGPVPGIRPKHELTVWFEEAHTTFPRREVLHPLLAEFMRTAMHRRLHIVFTSQKANDLPLEARELISHAMIFRHGHTATLNYLAELLGDKSFVAKIKNLEDRDFFELRDGRVTGPKRIKG